MRYRPAVVVALAFASGIAGAQQRVELGRAVAADVSVRISGGFASLRVTGWDHDSVSVSGTLGPGARFESAFGSVGTPPRGMKMYVDAPDGAATGTFELHVPKRARVWAKAGSATIDVSAVNGGLDLNVVGGSILVRDDPRELVAEAMDGSITIEGRPAYVRAKTATGDITMRGGSDDAGASTVGGAIRLTGGRWERVRLESVTGALAFGAELAAGGSLSFDSHSGPIELRLAPKSSAEVDARTITGAIDNSYSRTRPAIGREGRGQELTFSSGMGAAVVTIRSFKGNIRIATQ